MKERKIMSNDGIVIVIINTKNNKLITKPSIATRGFVVVNDNQELLHELENYVEKVIINSKNNDIKPLVINELSDYIFTKTGRKPIIMPVIMEIKKHINCVFFDNKDNNKFLFHLLLFLKYQNYNLDNSFLYALVIHFEIFHELLHLIHNFL